MREQFHTEWERAVKNKMMWIAVFIGCLLAIAQTVFEVYPYARNPLSFTEAVTDNRQAFLCTGSD